MSEPIFFLDDYQQKTAATAVYPGSGRAPRDFEAAMSYLGLKLAGESGEVCEKLGKWLRGDDGRMIPKRMKLDDSAIVKELGDVLWYVAQIASQLGVNLSTIATVNIDKLADRKARGVIKGSGDSR